MYGVTVWQWVFSCGGDSMCPSPLLGTLTIETEALTVPGVHGFSYTSQLASPWDPLVSPSPQHLSFMHVIPHPAFTWDLGGPNSGPQTCKMMYFPLSHCSALVFLFVFTLLIHIFFLPTVFLHVLEKPNQYLVDMILSLMFRRLYFDKKACCQDIG